MDASSSKYVTTSLQAYSSYLYQPVEARQYVDEETGAYPEINFGEGLALSNVDFGDLTPHKRGN